MKTPRHWIDVVGSAELRAAVDRIIRPDDWPGGWEEGDVRDYLVDCGTDLRWAIDALTRRADELERRGFASAA